MSYVVKIAENENAVLKIIQDEDAFNPRTECDNFGHMICWHSRYDLGDDHRYSEPRDFFEDLAVKFCTSKQLEKKFAEKFGDLTIVKNDNDDTWEIINKHGNILDDYKYSTSGFETKEDAEEELEKFESEFVAFQQDTIEEYLEMGDLMDIVEDHIVILPLHLYDHSGITISTSSFSCPWDSGQVGYTYVTHKEIIKEYGSLDIARAEKLLKDEVETYDQYLRGEVYGFILEKKVKCECCNSVDYESVDSCWGFYGMEYLEEELKSQLPKEYSELVDELDWAV